MCRHVSSRVIKSSRITCRVTGCLPPPATSTSAQSRPWWVSQAFITLANSWKLCCIPLILMFQVAENYKVFRNEDCLKCELGLGVSSLSCYNPYLRSKSPGQGKLFMLDIRLVSQTDHWSRHNVIKDNHGSEDEEEEDYLAAEEIREGWYLVWGAMQDKSIWIKPN